MVKKAHKGEKKRLSATALKQIKVLKNLGESGKNGKPMSMKRAMMDAGYSKNYAENGDMLKTATWKELIEDHVPDELVAETHEGLIKSKEIKQLYFYHKFSDEQIRKIIEAQGFTFIGSKRFMNTAVVFFTMPDNVARAKGLDLIYKIKSRYGDTTIVHKFGDLSDEDIEREAAGILSEVLGIEEGTS